MTKQMFVLVLLAWVSFPIYAFTEACQLVAQMAGPSYENKPNRFGSMRSPSEMPSELGAQFIGRNGGWFIYQGKTAWFDVDHCAPIVSASVEMVPVLLNKKTGHNAVINGIFLIKTYRQEHIDLIAARYGFQKVSPLPNRFTAVFDVKPQTSYDHLIETLDLDRDIEFAAPLLSEPRYRPDKRPKP
ncbi:hypothetical protein P8629_03150 [Hydrogenovibrio sp. 3SP14C1]|uniref:hypothetical protein n=1 Tax=Hydrogenovibrio sp. 3SP14C1 TaxID=3038774 RepID=UPI002416DBCC|nr:hypothetical protein [Hydrogenovibrio sp. 3SP14C1]MDG4811996.1 hypothetical protein [Hydrogenovibrio sp. 3SP14C1]